MKTLEEKVKMYESFLHLLQLNAEVVLDADAVRQLISNACSWSYAHRVGNGGLTYNEQQTIIDRALDKLCDQGDNNG